MTAPERYTGRAQKVLRHLAAKPQGVSMRGLVIAVEPGCKANNMWGTVSTLIGQKKVRRALVDDVTRFFITPTAFIDGRTAANAAKKGKPRAKRAQATTASGPSKRATAQPNRLAAASCGPTTASIPIPARKKPPASSPSTSGLFANVEHRQHVRAELAADVDAFLAGGGVIQRYAPGESAASIREQQERFLATRQRGRETPKTRRLPTAA